MNTYTNQLLLLMSLNNEESAVKPSTTIVHLYDDSTFDIEQFHTLPGEHGLYNTKKRLIRSVESVNLFTVEEAVKILKKEKYREINYRTPQDYRRQISELKKKIK